MSVSESRKRLYRIVVTGLMAALVYAGNYISIPVAGDTRIHIGNTLCLLSGLLFGGISGGGASGLGGAMFDLFNPKYITDAPVTFLTKFAMGFTAGMLNKSIKEGKLTVWISAAAGQVVYIILYLIKTYCSVVIIGGAHETAWAAVASKAAASGINAVLAVAISVPLYFIIKKVLKGTTIYGLMSRQ